MDSHRPVVVLGAGGHAAVLIETLRLLGRDVLGVVAPGPAGIDAGLSYLGNDDDLLESHSSHVDLVCGIGSAHNTRLRTSVILSFEAKGFGFASVIHPSAVVAASATVEAGAQVMAGAVISSGALIGSNAIVNTGAIVDHDCEIGAYAHIATGARLAGQVTVGQRCHVGAGATIIQQVRVGQDSVVGAGAVVINDVLAGHTVIGVPARSITDR